MPHSGSGVWQWNALADITFLTIYYPRNIIGHVNVNWLSPVKVRTTLIGGEKKMLIWNDLEADEKIKVYDRGVAIASGEARYLTLVSYRTGDMWAPRVEQVEALKIEAAYFVDPILNDKYRHRHSLSGPAAPTEGQVTMQRSGRQRHDQCLHRNQSNPKNRGVDGR